MKTTSSQATSVRATAIDDHPGVSAANARAGLVLFFIYTAGYAGFMGLVAFAPRLMAMPALGGVNLAITYGMGLIVGAFVVAGVYMVICGRNSRLMNDGASHAGTKGRR
jgi:uncharacterized membrane protein (DUF485 family)